MQTYKTASTPMDDIEVALQMAKAALYTDDPSTKAAALDDIQLALQQVETFKTPALATQTTGAAQ